MKKQNLCKEIIVNGLVWTLGFLIVFGIVTALFPTSFFIRMTPIVWLDYVFLVLTSLLLGLYISLHKYQKKFVAKSSVVVATVGGVGGFLGFGCALCNQLLLLLLGAAGVLVYVEPYRPLIGGVGVGLMTYAVYGKGKGILWRK